MVEHLQMGRGRRGGRGAWGRPWLGVTACILAGCLVEFPDRRVPPTCRTSADCPPGSVCVGGSPSPARCAPQEDLCVGTECADAGADIPSLPVVVHCPDVWGLATCHIPEAGLCAYQAPTNGPPQDCGTLCRELQMTCEGSGPQTGGPCESTRPTRGACLAEAIGLICICDALSPP